MTIKLLTPRDLTIGGRTVTYPAGALVTLDAATETGLINSKEATATLTGGIAYTPPVPSGQPVPLTVIPSAQGLKLFAGDTDVTEQLGGVRTRRIVKSFVNPSTAQGSIALPRNAVSLSISWHQGAGVASTAGALKFIVGAGSKDEGTYRLNVPGKCTRLFLGQRRIYMLDSLAVKRLDWATSAVETGSSTLTIDVEVLCCPIVTGIDVVNAGMCQLSTDAAIYDESGYERNGEFDAGLTAAAAAANPGYLTTGASTAGSQGASFPASIFSTVNPSLGGQYILRITMDAGPTAAGGQMLLGTINAGATPPDGFDIAGWPSGQVACLLRLSGVTDSEYVAVPGVLVSGVEHHYSVFVDGTNSEFSFWIDNTPIIVKRDFYGKSIHTNGYLRIANDLSSRSAATKCRGLRVINASGMTFDQATDMVELINLMHA